MVFEDIQIFPRPSSVLLTPVSRLTRESNPWIGGHRVDTILQKNNRASPFLTTKSLKEWSISQLIWAFANA